MEDNIAFLSGGQRADGPRREGRSLLRSLCAVLAALVISGPATATPRLYAVFTAVNGEAIEPTQRLTAGEVSVEDLVRVEMRLDLEAGDRVSTVDVRYSMRGIARGPLTGPVVFHAVCGAPNAPCPAYAEGVIPTGIDNPPEEFGLSAFGFEAPGDPIEGPASGPLGIVDLQVPTLRNLELVWPSESLLESDQRHASGERIRLPHWRSVGAFVTDNTSLPRLQDDYVIDNGLEPDGSPGTNLIGDAISVEDPGFILSSVFAVSRGSQGAPATAVRFEGAANRNATLTAGDDSLVEILDTRLGVVRAFDSTQLLIDGASVVRSSGSWTKLTCGDSSLLEFGRLGSPAAGWTWVSGRCRFQMFSGLIDQLTLSSEEPALLFGGRVDRLAVSSGGSAILGPGASLRIARVSQNELHSALYDNSEFRIRGGTIDFLGVHSQNGTFVEDGDVERVHLSGGDYLQLGGEVEQLEVDPDFSLYLERARAVIRGGLVERARVEAGKRYGPYPLFVRGELIVDGGEVGELSSAGFARVDAGGVDRAVIEEGWFVQQGGDIGILELEDGIAFLTEGSVHSLTMRGGQVTLRGEALTLNGSALPPGAVSAPSGVIVGHRGGEPLEMRFEKLGGQLVVPEPSAPLGLLACWSALAGLASRRRNRGDQRGVQGSSRKATLVSRASRG